MPLRPLTVLAKLNIKEGFIMTNTTSRKYLNLYTMNRYYNEVFDEWLKCHYIITKSNSAWNYGTESFINRESGEREYSEAKIMQRYVREKRPYFRNSDHFNQWLESNYSTQAEFFAA